MERRDLLSLAMIALVGCGQTNAIETDAAIDAPASDGSPTATDAGAPANGTRIELPSEGLDAYFGPGVFADLDGDGLDDMLLSSSNNRSTTPFRGGSFIVVYGRRERSGSPLDGGYAEIFGPEHQTAGPWMVRGDYDGDGLDDVAIGVPGIATDFGSLHVLYGSRTRLTGHLLMEEVARTVQIEGLVESPVTFPGGGTSAGDVDGDGRDDLLIGHPRIIEAGGVAYVVLGAATRWVEAAPVRPFAIFTLPPARAVAVAGGGDLDGDGHVDLVVADGAPDGFGLRANVFYGPITAGMHSVDDGDAHVTTDGWFASTGFDADGDGLADLAVSDGSGTEISIRLWLGSHTRLVGGVPLASAPIEIGPATPAAGLGSSFAVGDIDGDHLPDLLVGSPYGGGGRVDALFGPPRTRVVTTSERSWTGTMDEQLGMALSLGDFDGDGLDDTLLGARPDESRLHDAQPAGILFLVYGAVR